MSESSFSTLVLYFWISFTVSDSRVISDSSLVSMEEMMRQEARRAPRRSCTPRSGGFASTLSSSAGEAVDCSATLLMYSIISSYLDEKEEDIERAGGKV